MTAPFVTWTVNSFIEAFPEFKYAGELIPRALADAALQVDRNVYGPKADMAIGLIAAIRLSGSPYAQSQKLVSAEQSTEYETRLTALKLQVRVGIIVL